MKLNAPHFCYHNLKTKISDGNHKIYDSKVESLWNNKIFIKQYSV